MTWEHIGEIATEVVESVSGRVSGKWTAERIEVLTDMWSAGNSGSEIAGTLGGVTRNAVIGKAHRLGLAGHQDKAARDDRKALFMRVTSKRSRRREKATAPTHTPTRAQIAEHLGTAPLPAEDTPTGPLVMFADLEAHHCRAPYGDPKLPGFGFCGCKKVPGTSYCAEHLRRFTSESQPRPQSTRALNPNLDASMTTRIRPREFVG